MKYAKLSPQVLFGFGWLAAGLAFAPALSAQSNFSTPYTFTTLAGTALTGGSTNATGAAASFFFPGGIAVDAGGNVYVADAGNNVLRKITAGGVVTTFAGQVGAAAGSLDGTGASVQFSALGGVAVDTQGNVYVADVISSTIRKITPGGVSSTLAGTPGVMGFADGPGFSAQFNRPQGVAVDGAGNVYVADSGNAVIRRITPAGVVSTIAGIPGLFAIVNGAFTGGTFQNLVGVAVDISGNVFASDAARGVIFKLTPAGVLTTFAGTLGLFGSADGTGTAALLNNPGYISTDGAGNLYVADTSNAAIRRITPAGVVSTLGGQPLGVITTNPGAPIVLGSKDGTGSVAQFNLPLGVAATPAGNIFVTDTANFTIRAGVPATASNAPTLVTQVASQRAAAGANVTFSVAVGPSNLSSRSFQWFFNGVAISGATSSSLTISKIAAANAGSYTVTVTNGAGSITSGGATLSLVTPPASTSYATPYGVTTLAGTAGSFGSAVGTGAAARFGAPEGTAADASGNVYVADGSNGTILKVTPAGLVTTLAGTAGVFGSSNGTGAAALFVFPVGLAVDASGNVFVAHYGAGTIRKITSAGVVTTLAGTAGVIGSADGTGAAAQFYNPAGLALDASGNLYVADSFNDTIRKVTSAGVVTTLAGTAGTFGAVNATGAAAQFSFPVAVAVDGSGNVYVADGFNNMIRKVTSAGVVTTLAGATGTAATGSADGTGTAAQFNFPQGLAVDGSGNVYVADSSNNTIRRVTSAGVVTTLAGLPGAAGSADGTGPTAQFNAPQGVSVDGSGNLYVADTLNGTVRKAALPPVAPAITAQPQSSTVTAGASASFSVTATGTATLTFQWLFNGAAISGATSSTFSIATTTSANAGSYTVTVSNAGGSVTSSAATLTVNAAAATTTTAAAPAPSSGGGGAPGTWFYGALALLVAVRQASRRRRLPA